LDALVEARQVGNKHGIGDDQILRRGVVFVDLGFNSAHLEYQRILWIDLAICRTLASQPSASGTGKTVVSTDLNGR
jgi:hypothetical protein